MYSQATIKRARTIIANVERTPARKPTRTRSQAKPVVKASAPVHTDDIDRSHMIGKPVTNGQLKAINGYERKLGYRLSTKAQFADMADASRVRASLKAELA